MILLALLELILLLQKAAIKKQEVAHSIRSELSGRFLFMAFPRAFERYTNRLWMKFPYFKHSLTFDNFLNF